MSDRHPELTLGELRRLVHEMRELPDETVILTPIGPPGPKPRLSAYAHAFYSSFLMELFGPPPV